MDQVKQEPLKIGSAVGKEVSCAQCKKTGTSDQFFTYALKDKSELHLCKTCKDSINEALASQTKNINWVGALIGGAIAGICGGMVWYFIAVITKMEFGYAAIGLGYLIGHGITLGAGRKYSIGLQIFAFVATVFTIFIAEHSIYAHYLIEYLENNVQEFSDAPGSAMISLDWFDEGFLQSLISPIGLVIYVIAAYVAYSVPKPKRI